MGTHYTQPRPSLVQYIEPEWGMPGARYFRCEPMAATITTQACAANWRASCDRESERLMKCRTCPVGAIHAGETAASLSPLRGATICSRCLVGSSRLVRGWLCVSCYNREREYLAGRNAKGKAPIKMLPLHRRTLRVIENGQARHVSREHTATLEELMAATLRDSAKTVVFAFNGGPSAKFSQGVLW